MVKPRRTHPGSMKQTLAVCCAFLLLMAWPAIAQDAAPLRPAADLSKGLSAESITVRWAAFGNFDQWTDVTAYCQKQLKNRRSIRCSEKALGRLAPPPIYRGGRDLILLLDTAAGPIRLRLTEGGFFSTGIAAKDLPPVGPGRRWSKDHVERADLLLGKPDSGIDVIWAYWGSGRYGRSIWVDLTEQFANQMEAGSFKSFETGLKAGVPEPRMDRVTRMLISAGGEAIYLYLSHKSEVNARPDAYQTQRPWQLRDWQPPAFPHALAQLEEIGNALQWGLSKDGKAVFAVHPETGQWAELDPETLKVKSTKTTEQAKQSGWQIRPRLQSTDGSIPGDAYSDYTLIDDSRYILQSDGVILANRQDNNRDRDRFTKITLPQNYGAIANRELGVLALFCRNQIKLYQWPSLEVIHDIVLQGTLVDPRFVEESTVFYVRCLDEPTVTDRGKLVQDDAMGRLMRIDLLDLMPGGGESTPERGKPLRGEATGHPNIALRLPLRSDLTDIAYSDDGKAAYLMDAGAGRVYHINPQTLEIVDQSKRLPAGTHRVSLAPSGKHVWLACAPTPFHPNKDEPGGTILQLDAKDLSKKPIEHLVEIDPYDLAVVGTGKDRRVFVTDGSNQWTHLIEYAGLTLKEQHRTGISDRSLITRSPHGSLLIVGGNQGLGYVSTAVPGKSRVRSLSLGDRSRSRGQSYLSSDGSFIMTEGSDLLKVHYVGEHRAAVIHEGHLGPRDRSWFPQPLDMIAGMEHCDGHLVICDLKGQLWRVDPDTLETTPGPVFEGIVTDLRYDKASQRLVAIYRPGAVISNHGAYKRPINAELVAIDVKAWLSNIQP